MSETEFLVKYIELAADYAHVWGFLIIFILMALESSIVPFPSEVIMIPAGFMAFRGELSFGLPMIDLIIAVSVGTAGCLAGAYFNYYLGKLLGRPFLYKYGKYLFLKKDTLKKAEKLFYDYGSIATFVGRLLPAIRQFVSIPAGFAKMKHLPFAVFTALGAGIWTAILALIGYYFGSISEKMTYASMVYKGTDMIMENYIWLFFALLIVITAYILFHFRKKLFYIKRKHSRKLL
ncbi:MAG TPA: DedA family protein [Victivallales bacterium]|nr:DedA family protein [Victivallales bacterium]